MLTAPVAVERPHHEWLFVCGMALLLCLLMASVVGAVQRADQSVPVRLEALPQTDDALSTIGADGQALLLPGGRARESRALVRFQLPADGGDGRWVLWVGRSPVEDIAFAAPGWHSHRRNFFAPAADEGILPSGFLFPLPAGLTGEVALELQARAALRGVLRVKVVREAAAMRVEQAGAAMSAAIYAALFTLALITLTLYAAARDRIYLLFFGATTAAMLLLAAQNGHLYQLPFFGLLSGWRGQGIWALGLLFLALTLQLLERYAQTRHARPPLAVWVDRYCLVLSGLAAACLLRLQVMDAVLPWLGTLAWSTAALGGLLLILDGVRRRVPMALPVAMLAGLTLAAAGVTEVLTRGRWLDPVWLRYGYQMVLVAAAAVLAVGLVSRISEYRNQRDRDRLARADSEKRMRREAARADLNTALQTKLRSLPAGDVEWAAFRLLLDHLVPQVPVEFATVLAYGFQGQDITVVVPQSQKPTVDDIAARRLQPLKRHAANGMPLQQPVTVPTQHSVVAMEAVVPLPIRAPAWGVLLLHRTGGDGFATEELALAGEFARLALLNVEQSLSAINLRRSAELDALTGTFNRRTIDQWLTRTFADADRDGQPVSVLFVDMDHFKSINDRHGHACGDQCLRQVAATLRGALSDGDLLGRYGGEEFIAVLPGRGGAGARAVGEQLRAAVERMDFEWEGTQLPLTVSVGVATRLHHEDSAPQTVDRADKALYTAKRGGRNRVQVAPAVFS